VVGRCLFSPTARWTTNRHTQSQSRPHANECDLGWRKSLMSFLGHQPSRLKVVAENEDGRTISRDYRKADEEAAYRPRRGSSSFFPALRRFVLEGQTSLRIARHFTLVAKHRQKYRLKSHGVLEDIPRRNPDLKTLPATHK